MNANSQTDKIIGQLLQSMEKPSPQALYQQLGRLRNEMPARSELGKASSSKWAGQVLAVVEAAGATVELIMLRTSFESTGVEYAAISIARQIDTVLAKLELQLPAAAQGAFIPAGGVFDGYQAVSKAMSEAQTHLLLVDPYADDTVVSDFVVLAPETVPVFLLSDSQTAKPSLKPAAQRWITQWQQKRPLEVRLAPAKALHDRLLIVDGGTAWVIGQSFKDLAKRAHSSLVRMDPDSAKLKIAAHFAMWQQATKIT